MSELQIIEWNGRKWYVDRRLKELRNVNIPWERIDFEKLRKPCFEKLAYKLLSERRSNGR